MLRKSNHNCARDTAKRSREMLAVLVLFSWFVAFSFPIFHYFALFFLFFVVLLVFDSLRSVCIDGCFALVFGWWFELSFEKMLSTQIFSFGWWSYRDLK